MYIKVSTGTSFANAAQYNETGLSPAQRRQKAGKVESVATYNLLSSDARGIAFEMNNVASFGRSTQPVWNVSMSAAPGQVLTAQQWQASAEQYLRQMGADPAHHQIAIWRHQDTDYDHVHVLINAVPIGGGAALSRFYTGKKAQRIAGQIDKFLGLVAGKAKSVKVQIQEALATTLTERRPTSLAELVEDLSEVGIRCIPAMNAEGPYGLSFQVLGKDHHPVKGSAVGYKCKQVVERLEANRADYLREQAEHIAEIERLKKELDQKPPTVEIQQPAEAYQVEIDRLRHERDEAYRKRNAMQEAFLNQAPKTIIKEVEVIKEIEVIREVVKSDPADKQQIESLQERVAGNYKAFVAQKKLADKVPELVEMNKELLAIAQKRLSRLEQSQREYAQLSQTYKAHIEKYTDLERRFQEQRARLEAKLAGEKGVSDSARLPAVSSGVVSPGADQVPSVVVAEPDFYARFRTKITTHLPARSPVDLAQKLGNTYFAKPHLGMEYKEGELHFVSGKHRASARQLGFSATLGYAETDLKKLPSLDRSQGQGL